MTIRETVKQALTGTCGNKPVTLGDIVLSAPTVECNGAQISILIANDITQDQFKRALRDIPYVRKLADGRYIVKGRKVPAQSASKPAKIVKCYSCHKFATRNSRIDQDSGICGRCAQTVDRKAAKRATQPKLMKVFGTIGHGKTYFGGEVLEYIDGPLVDIKQPEIDRKMASETA